MSLLIMCIFASLLGGLYIMVSRMYILLVSVHTSQVKKQYVTGP